MSKATITALFVAAFVTVVAGSVLALGAVVTAISSGVVSIGGPQFVTVNGAAFAGTLPWMLVASLVLALGGLAALVSWIAALINTYGLADRTWFVALLVLGLCSLGWLAMIAYVLAGPDSTKRSDGAPPITVPATA